MKLHLLATFLQVAEAGSLSRAALAAEMATSRVSQQIAELETAWGGRLFDRTGRGMVLTALGARMLPQVQRLVDELHRLDVAARDAAGVPTGLVHVGMLPSMSRRLLPPLLARLREQAPQVRLHVSEGFSGALDEQLSSGRLDMIVVNRYGESAKPGEDVLGHMDTCLIGKPGAALLARPTVSFAQLAGQPMVLPARPNGFRSMLDALLRRHGVTPAIALEVDTVNMMKDVALSGQAMTLLPAMAVSEELAAGALAVSRIVRPGIRRTIALGVGRQRPPSLAVRYVAAQVGQLARQLLREAG
ncbi:LysR family transcriptional regulator, partial [Orrella sp. JC864]|uniref:LysR family transcriptional regulator n=1 Tax=Orrella sp. JC864 TaxID=3120298 RepID=UPI00300B288D